MAVLAPKNHSPLLPRLRRIFNTPSGLRLGEFIFGASIEKALKSVLIISAMFLVQCSNEGSSSRMENPTVLSTDNRYLKSTEVGNFATTAVRRANDLDIVFLPSSSFSKDTLLVVKPDMNEKEIGQVLEHFPRDAKDQLLVGIMKGSRIKDFIIDRVRETYDVEMEVDGLNYSISINGGFITAASFVLDNGRPIDDDDYYRVAVSDDFYFGDAFPGYKYRNGFNFNFRRERYHLSLRESVRAYLKMGLRFPYWGFRRASVYKVPAPDQGYKKISEIQGPAHTSPYFGKKVTTRGVVIAFGTADWYPFGNDVYIQSTEPDDDDRTSEGLHVFITSNKAKFDLGDEIEVTGVVYEDLRKNGMAQTSLRDVSDFKIISDPALPVEEKLKKLPPATLLGEGGRPIPTDRISTYGGLLMQKKSLTLTDGIDFWESLEGMRVELKSPTILGFRGGEEELIEVSQRFYLNLYVTAENQRSANDITYRNGLMINFEKDDFNPEIVTIMTNHLSKNDGLVPKDKNASKYIFNVGDVIEGSVTGVLTYQKNVFGGGEYSIVLPQPQDAFAKRNHRREFTPVLERGTTTLHSDKNDEVTVATLNLENLAGHQHDRIKVFAEAFAYNMKCPDVINLVEVQDNNGISLRDDQDATETLKKLRGMTQSMCLHKNYQIVNVDPYLNAEGGQPGGNIRTSLFYNANKLSFNPRNDGSVGDQALVRPNGELSSNPGRIFPNHEAFRGSRRSVVTELDVLSKPGEKLYIIGNHLNSKLGDIDFWGNLQPARANSDFRRAQMAAKINDFIRWVELENPKANIVVLGDFNALPEEGSLSALSNREKTLKNMLFTIPRDKRYTTNYNGNSQAIDHIFVNNRLFNGCAELEILHINTDYMGRLSDHDPLVLKTCY